jgi:hypothetical protein
MVMSVWLTISYVLGDVAGVMPSSNTLGTCSRVHSGECT